MRHPILQFICQLLSVPASFPSFLTISLFPVLVWPENSSKQQENHQKTKQDKNLYFWSWTAILKKVGFTWIHRMSFQNQTGYGEGVGRGGGAGIYFKERRAIYEWDTRVKQRVYLSVYAFGRFHHYVFSEFKTFHGK